jgi:hypothetical protein
MDTLLSLAVESPSQIPDFIALLVLFSKTASTAARKIQSAFNEIRQRRAARVIEQAWLQYTLKREVAAALAIQRIWRRTRVLSVLGLVRDIIDCISYDDGLSFWIDGDGVTNHASHLPNSDALKEAARYSTFISIIWHTAEEINMFVPTVRDLTNTFDLQDFSAGCPVRVGGQTSIRCHDTTNTF